MACRLARPADSPCGNDSAEGEVGRDSIMERDPELERFKYGILRRDASAVLIHI
jgi:hypothetical protein